MKDNIINEYHLIIKNEISQLRFDSAIGSIAKLLAYSPSDDMGYYYLGVCYFAQEKYFDALKSYATAIKINPAHARAYFNLGICYYLENKYDAALINFGKSLIIFTKTKEINERQRCIDAINLIEVQRGV